MTLVEQDVRQIVTRYRCFEAQRVVLANDSGIDVVIAGIGGGKTWIAGLKALFWALQHPQQASGAPSEWLVLGRDFNLTREVQLEEILRHARNLAYLGEPREARVVDLETPATRACIFGGEDGVYTSKAPSPRARPTVVVESWVSRDVFRVRPVVPLPYRSVVKRATAGLNPEIELVNGVLFRGFSSTDVTRIKGFGFDGAWLDEADHQTAMSFEIAMNRQRSGHGIRMIITSSPAAAGQGWLWQLISGKDPQWDPVRATNKLRVHRWKSEDNPTNDPAQLAAIRAAMEAASPGRSKGELDGLFLGTEEAPGSNALEFVRGFVGRVKLGPEDCRAAVLGVDLGMTTDFTWLTVLSKTGVVLAMERFNVSTPGVPRDSFYPHVEYRIRELIAKWRIPLVKIDTATWGAGFVQYVSKSLAARIEGYRTDGVRKKSELLETLGVALGRGAIKIPHVWVEPTGVEHTVEHVEQLRREFGELQTLYHEGYRTFTHPTGGHDDGVVSLGLAYQGLATRPPSGGPLNFKQPHLPKFYGYGSSTPFGPFGPYFG